MNVLQAVNIGEFQVSKLSYTIDHLYSKYDDMLDKFENLERDRDSRIAQLARKQFPYILDYDYEPGKKGKGKVRIFFGSIVIWSLTYHHTALHKLQ